MNTDADANTGVTYTVSREGTVLVTLHEGTDTTARTEATSQVETTFEDLTRAESIEGWELTDAGVHEHPAAPFDPYTVAVEFTVSVTVDAVDASAAESVGASAISDALETAEMDAVSYTSAPVTSRT